MYSCISISMYVYTYIHINTVMHRIAVTSSATIQYRQDASFCRYVELRNDFDDFAKKKKKKKRLAGKSPCIKSAARITETFVKGEEVFCSVLLFSDMTRTRRGGWRCVCHLRKRLVGESVQGVLRGLCSSTSESEWLIHPGS